MNGGRQGRLTGLFVAAVSFIAVCLSALLLTGYYSRVQFQQLGGFCGEILERHPECRQDVLEILKENGMDSGYSMLSPEENILLSFGYRQKDFLGGNRWVFFIAGVGFLVGNALFVFAFRYGRKRLEDRIESLTGYLEKVNTGGQGLLLAGEEDVFSGLRDEIYKTITMLYQTRDTARKEKENYAENLSNIAHQLKTPITAISLSVQMMRAHPGADYAGQIERQLYRLSHLEEALLLLSRIDAGTLSFKRNAVDVFTLLTLASDNLQELFRQKGVSVDIPETGEILVMADLDWTMEAVMNLMKNCMEHTGAGTVVHCSYEKNPLYVQVRIWDEGGGFAREELPHLFERFYRGRNGGEGGIGIGLSLSKAIIEMQNGVIRAFNLRGGGACFEIRFYG